METRCRRRSGSASPAVIELHPLSLTEWLPGLQKDERAVWKRWLNVHGRTSDRVAYAVRLPPDESWEIVIDPAIPEDAKVLLALEVDVILERDARFTIIEVKPRLCMSALGQLLVYRYELERRRMLPPGSEVLCVAGQDNPALRLTFAHEHVGVLIV